MNFRLIKTVCILGITGTLFCSCAYLPKTNQDVPVVIPESYALSMDGDSYPDRWWTIFQDEQLNELIKEAFEGNLGLRQVQHRLEQAQAVARKAGAEHIPQVSIDGSAANYRSRQIDATGAKSIQTVDQFGLNLAASYEIDLWGRIGATKRAAVLDAQTAHDNLDTAAMTLAAQITDSWYQIASFQERLSLLRSQIESSENHVRLLELRFNTGQVTALNVLQQREQLAALRTLLPNLEAVLTTARHQLAVLLGRPPQMTKDLVPSDWPKLPPLPNTGVPADLLQKRPDVQAALRMLRADNERVAAAVADRLPALRLTASAGYSSPDAGDLFDDMLWNIAGNILAPVLDGGRRRAEVDRTHALVRERLARCGEVLLNAIREVEDALVNEDKQKEVVKHQAEQHEAALQTLEQARARFQRGLTDYVFVLNALKREQFVARTLVETRRQLLSNRIQLYRSLGGHWMRSEIEGEKENE